jgi:hypothetical protein
MFRIVLRVLLPITGALLALFTLAASCMYFFYMVFWLHAPPVQVFGVSALISLPFLAASWGALRFARKFKDFDAHQP